MKAPTKTDGRHVVVAVRTGWSRSGIGDQELGGRGYQVYADVNWVYFQ
jgi:hypothetical protein